MHQAGRQIDSGPGGSQICGSYLRGREGGGRRVAGLLPVPSKNVRRRCRLRHPPQPPMANPHGRGEDDRCQKEGVPLFGTPPRTWGRRFNSRGRRIASRYTPTDVGKTPSPPSLCEPGPVHPHGRGEDFLRDRLRPRDPGTPPRTWGRRSPEPSIAVLKTVHPHGRGEDGLGLRLGERPVRYTPTDVGKTTRRSGGIRSTPVHPHGRGEDLGRTARGILEFGTPPRTWGRRPQAAREYRALRYTPTDVGKTIAGRSGRPSRAVHPHGRGEDFGHGVPAHPTRGTPPRTWGRQVPGVGNPPEDRYTPTDVGKTETPPLAPPPTAVHPHGRGEDSTRRVRRPLASGTPPRTWGRQVGAVCLYGVVRYTPTDVGKTRGRRTWTERSTVHPHGRGEDFPTSHPEDAHHGTPPRTWGRRVELLLSDDDYRYTPTDVGKTLPGPAAPEPAAVHPHGRGEDEEPTTEEAIAFGTPPRTWGRLSRDR